MVSAEERLAALGLRLPPPPRALAAYTPTVRADRLVFVSGQVPFVEGKPWKRGKLGAGIDITTGQEAARIAALNLLSALREAAASLDQIERLLRITVFVASAPGFNAQPQVADGASKLLVDVLGDAGLATRSAVGVAELPADVPVEIDAIALLRADALAT